MPSGNKWNLHMKTERLSNKGNKDYRIDDTMNENSNPIMQILATTAILAGGVLAYKKGLFKGASKSVLDMADAYGKNTLNIAPTLKTFNKWADMGKLETEFTNSIFRGGFTTKNIFKDNGVRKILTETKDDVLDLSSRVRKIRDFYKNSANLNNRLYKDTELAKELGTINSITDQFARSKNGVNASHRVKTMMTEDLYDYAKQTKEVSQAQIKRHGYRNLTLGDIYSLAEGKNGNKKLMEMRTDFSLDSKSREMIEDFIKTTRISDVGDDGKAFRTTIINTDKWKDFRVDKGLMISDKGKIIDVRYASKYSSEFIRSLSNNYQVPMLNFNPLRFLGFDKVGMKKSRYGIVHQSTVQNALTNLPGRHTLEQSGKFGELPLLFMNGNVFQVAENQAASITKIATNMQAEKINKKMIKGYGLRSDLNYYRKMVGLNTKEFVPYTADDGAIKNMYGKVMSKLDIGFQDRDIMRTQTKVITTASGNQKEIVVNADESIFSINRIIEDIRDKILKKVPTPYKEVKESVPISRIFGTVSEDQDLYLLRHKDVNVKEFINNTNIDTISQYFKETISGRTNPSNVGARGTFVYSLADRLNQSLSNVGLGLSMDNIGSTKDVLSNLVTKRFLPIYGAYQTMQYITYLSERDNENKGNIQKNVANAFKTVDLAYHKIKDISGITTVAKRLGDLMPGSDQITGLPGVSGLALDQTYEERKKYYESGMTEIRKGRYWGLGNTPFTGGKISYFKPNMYRRIQGDVMYSDSKYGSREEYFKNAWFPTLSHPLAPIRHFVTDKYHYDKKHYYDRPYPITSAQFANVPIIGDVLSGTIGKVIKPQKVMHENFFLGNSASVEKNPKGTYDIPNIYGTKEEPYYIEANKEVGEMLLSSHRSLNFDTDPSKYLTREQKEQTPIIYTTSSGRKTVFGMTDETDIDTLNEGVNSESIKNIDGVGAFSLIKTEEDTNIFDVNVPNDLKTTMASQYTNLTNLTGMTGYITETFLTGTPMENEKMLDSPSNAYSFNKTFWDQEIGGLGGELSEIMRRFIPDKNKDFEYINPITNTMPSWMPGDDYFIDFTKGDPYTKVKWGEGRLPGQGYERLWGIDDKGGDFESYDAIDRVRILGDVAPYSNEFAENKKLLREEFLKREEEISKLKANLRENPDDEKIYNEVEAKNQELIRQKEELKEIEERASKQKQPLRVYDYKFKTANLEEKEVVVDQVINNDTFTVKGEDETSYTLGGISVKQPDTAQGKREFNEYISSRIKEGTKLTVKVDANEVNRRPSGVNKSIKAIVEDSNENINKELVRRGYATFKEDDDSPIGVNLQYSAFDRLFGSIVERFTHMDTYFNTKYMQVRSPLEHYKRNVVYGEDFQEWDRPVENFLKPTVNKMIERPAGLLIAPMIGAMFGRTKSSSMIGAMIGFGAVLAGKAYVKTNEAMTEQKWIPKSRQKETDIDEYFDKLKYVKNIRLYNEYAKKSLEEDNFDIKEYQDNEKEEASKRKDKVRKLERDKKELNRNKKTMDEFIEDNEEYEVDKATKSEIKKREREEKFEIIKKAAKTFTSNKPIGDKLEAVPDIIEDYKQASANYDKRIDKARKKNVNADINSIKTDREVELLPENAVKALEFFQAAKETVYGYEPGDSVQDLMKAIPKTEKDFFKYFIDAPEEEQGEIMQVLPSYLKNAMANMWGNHTTEKEPLSDYFSKHQLPDEKWVGWDEGVDLSDVRVKMVNKEDLEYSNFSIWDDDVEKASQREIPIPHLYRKNDRNKAQMMLKRLMEESGYSNVQVSSKGSMRNNIEFNIANDERPYVDSVIKSGDYFGY